MSANPLAAAFLAISFLTGCATLREEAADPIPATPELARLMAEADANPLLAPWTGPYGGLPSWDRLSVDQFPAAFELGIALQAAEFAAIAENPAWPTFRNTIEAMQHASHHLARAVALFWVLNSSFWTPESQQLADEWLPRLAEAEHENVHQHALFRRIDYLYRRRGSRSFDAEQLRMLELTHESFVRAGIALGPARQARLAGINADLASLYAEFRKRVQADEFTSIDIDREEDLSGFPQEWRDALARHAQQFDRPGRWALITVSTGVAAALVYAEDRALRERVWRAYWNRGDKGDANDTNGLITQIVALRTARANLLGFRTHAHYRMSGSMAQDPVRVRRLMMRLWPAAVARARRETTDVQEFAAREGAEFPIEPWDYRYYGGKLRSERHPVDQAAINKYFALDNMIAAAFHMAERLYGLKFIEVTETVPVYHPEVRVFDVRDRIGAVRGLYFLDCFARHHKQPGSLTRVHWPRQAPISARIPALITGFFNFVKPPDGGPVLISPEEARMLFREIGTTLHVLLADVRYPGLVQTPLDYGAYLARLHERWALARPTLDRFALHVETGESIPQQLVDRIRDAENTGRGRDMVGFLASALVDLEAHTRRDGIVDPDAIERETLAALGMPRGMTMSERLPQSVNLFTSDGPASVVYPTLWAHVLAADTWAMFEVRGDVFDPGVAGALRGIILGEGNASDRAEAYRRFRGRDPDIKPLLRDWGFPGGD